MCFLFSRWDMLVPWKRSTGCRWFREDSGSSHQAEKVTKKAEKAAKTLEHGWYPHPNLLLATSGCDIEAWHWRLMSKTKWFHTPLAMVKRSGPLMPPLMLGEVIFWNNGGWFRMEWTKKNLLGILMYEQPTCLKATFYSSIFHLLLPFLHRFDANLSTQISQNIKPSGNGMTTSAPI